MNSVEVYLDSLDAPNAEPTHVGTLAASFTGGRALGGSSFQYSAEYLAHPRVYALSPELPLLTARQYTDDSRSQFGAFADAAPDEWGRKIVEADYARRRAGDPTIASHPGPFDLLLGVADRTRMGAVRFRARGAGAATWLSPDDGAASVHDLDRVIAAASRYSADEATDEDIAYLSDIATSPGGARPKANVVTDTGGLAIAKLPHSKDGSIDVERWEALAFTLASRADISVPRFEWFSAGAGATVLVSHRFDRRTDASRIGYMSAATVMGVGENDPRSITYVDYADALAEISENPAADLRELYARIALTVLINNVDDHWRNHGVLRSTTGWRLAPAFDLNPSRTRGVITSRPISSTDDPRRRDLRSLLAVASSFGLSRSDAAAVIRLVGQSVAGWRLVALKMQLDERQVSAMAPAFDEEQLDYALGLG